MWISSQKLSLLLRLDIIDEAYFKFKQEERDKNRRRVGERENAREVQTFYCGERKSIILLDGLRLRPLVFLKSTAKVKTLEVVA
jgi:hypothetical protein